MLHSVCAVLKSKDKYTIILVFITCQVNTAGKKITEYSIYHIHICVMFCKVSNMHMFAFIINVDESIKCI